MKYFGHGQRSDMNQSANFSKWQNSKSEAGGEALLTPVASHRSLSPVGLRPRLDEQQGEKTTSTQIQSHLQSDPTTAVSLTDIGSQLSEPVAAGKDDNVTSTIKSLPGALKAKASLGQMVTSDSASTRSSIPNTDASEQGNIFSDFVASEYGSNLHEPTGFLEFPKFQQNDFYDGFSSEFEPVGELGEDGQDEGFFSKKKKKKKGG